MQPRLLGVLFGAASLIAGTAAARDARGPDGRWVADVPPQPFCSPSRMTLDVSGGTIAGNVVNDEGVFAVAGDVDESGAGTIRIGQVGGVIRFTSNRFVADYPNLRCGMRRAIGARVG
jgi:hypothetical protein